MFRHWLGAEILKVVNVNDEVGAAPIHQISEADRVRANELLAEIQATESQAAVLYEQAGHLIELQEQLVETTKKKKLQLQKLVYGNIRHY